MRKRFVYLGALLALFFLSSYCDQDQCKKNVVKKIAVVKNESAAKHDASKPVDITNFFLFN